MSSRSDPSPRYLPGFAVRALLALPLACLIWLQLTDGTGDEGMNNVFSYMAVALTLLVYGLWFVLASGHSGRRRGLAVALALGMILLLSLTVRVDAWTGALLPEVRWAWQAPRGPQLENAALEPESESALDLLTTTPLDFPGFLGSDRTGQVPGVALLGDWSTSPPELLWRVPVGAGWSGFAVVNGVAVTQEQRGQTQVVVARDLNDGSELWRYSRPGEFKSMLAGDGPRATPLIDSGLVFVQDVLGAILCLDGRNGHLIWEHNLRAEYGMTDELEAQLIGYGRSASPVVHGDLLICAAGGDPAGKRAGIVAFDKRTGELRWEGPPRAISHASPNVATLAGVTQIVVTNEDTLSGHDTSDGHLLWEHPWPGKTAAEASNSQPTPVGADGIIMSKGYGRGSALIQLVAQEDGAFDVRLKWSSRRSLRTKFTNPVVHGEHAYALSDGMLECVSLSDGKRVWKDGRYGHGQMLLVGRGEGAYLLVLSEEGELLLIEARPDRENAVLGAIEALDGKTWNTIALYGDRVVIRNAREAACFRLPLVQG